jgi:hypothetical protein
VSDRPESSVISCVVPAFNAERTLTRAIESVLAQRVEGRSVEVVVVDDGSTDGTAAAARALAARDARVVVVTQTNRGVSAARNAGIDRACGGLVHFCDADDWVLPGAYAALAPLAERHGAAYGGYELARGDGTLMGRQTPAIAWCGLSELAEWNRVQPNAQVVRRDVLGSERFDVRFQGMEDWDLWLRLAERGVRWRGVDAMVAVYRQTGGGLSKRYASMDEGVAKVLAACAARVGSREERATLARARGGAALQYATMTALAGRGGRDAIEAASELWAERGGGGVVTAREAAQAVVTGLMLGVGMGPEVDGAAERVWLPWARAWWDRLEEAGWMMGSERARAEAELAVKVIHPDRIAEGVLSAAGVGTGTKWVVVSGAHAAGRRTARAASARGMSVVVDARGTAEDEREMLGVVAGVRVVATDGEWAEATGAMPARAPAGVVDFGETRRVELGSRRVTRAEWGARRDVLALSVLARLRAVG